MNTLHDLLAEVPAWDIVSAVIDIVIVYYVAYRSMLLMRGTRAIQMLVGIVLVLALFFVSEKPS